MAELQGRLAASTADLAASTWRLATLQECLVGVAEALNQAAAGDTGGLGTTMREIDGTCAARGRAVTIEAEDGRVTVGAEPGAPDAEARMRPSPTSSPTSVRRTPRPRTHPSPRRWGGGGHMPAPPSPRRRHGHAGGA